MLRLYIYIYTHAQQIKSRLDSNKDTPTEKEI